MVGVEPELELVVRLNDVSYHRGRLCEGAHRVCSERLHEGRPFVVTARVLGQLDRVHDGMEVQRVRKLVVVLFVR